MNEYFRKIRGEEGFKLKAYLCTKGKWTIGVGRNIQDRPLSTDEIALLPSGTTVDRGFVCYPANLTISKELAELMLSNDVKRCLGEARKLFVDFDSLPQVARMVIVDMLFQLGLRRFLGFRNMSAYMRSKTWHRAADELLNSKYAREDTPNRARRNADLLRSIGGTHRR